MVDIHKQKALLDKNLKGYISKLRPEDQKDVRRFIGDLLAQSYSPGRLNKYLATLVTISRKLDTPFTEATKDDVKRFIAWLEISDDYKPWYKHDIKVILRRYMRWLGKAETVDWLKIKTPKNGTLPEEVLTEEEIKRLAEAAYTTRDKAFILMLYESGARIGEILPLKIKHLSFDRHGALVYLSGKTGDRKVRLVASVIALQEWLNEHPRKNNPDAYLWCKVPMPNNPKWKNQHLSYGFISRLLKELAVKAEVKKKVNPHAFRHARATFMARHLKEPEMRQFFGWGRDSEMPSIYVHLSGRDVDSSVLGIYGIKEAKKDQEPTLKVQSCPRCQEHNDPASRFCGKCGLPLNQPYAGDRLEVLVVELLKIVAETNPGIKDRFRELVREKEAEELFA
jgi:integrase/ribosomal protein S27AE